MKLTKFKRVIILLLAALLAVTPVTNVVAASGASSSGATGWNEALLQFLIDEYGVDQALQLYHWLQDVRLVDENGQLVRHPIHLDGQDYTLEAFKALLDSGDLDLTKTAYVDGQPIPVEALKKIIELEDRLALLAENYKLRMSTFTPQHLDSLISLIDQAGTVGLSVYGADFDVPPETDGPKLGAYSLSTAPFEDEVYVELDWITPHSPDVYYNYNAMKYNFKLSRPLYDREVSFDYEIVSGSLGSGYQRGTVVFAPGETEKSIVIEISGREQVPDRNPTDTFSSTRDFMDTVWYRFARADFIHFFNFRNFDYMKERDNGLPEVQEIDYVYWNPYYSSTYARYLAFMFHAYEGGAYATFSPIRGKGTDPNPESILPMIQQAENRGINVGAVPQIVEVHAKDGAYMTGQIVPIRVLYSVPVMHKGDYDPLKPVVFDSRLLLANGQEAQPEIESYGRFEFSHGYGSLSFVRGYYAVVTKGTKLSDLRVVSSKDLAALDYWLDYGKTGQQGDPDLALKKLPEIGWNKAFTNESTAQIVFTPHRADAFKSISLDKTHYKIGETAKVTVELENGNNETDWILNGLTSSDELSKRFYVSLVDRDQFAVPLDWARDANGQPILTRLEGTFEVTEELYNRRASDGRLRAKIYYNRDSNTNGEDPATFGMWQGGSVFFTIEPPNYIEAEELEIVYPSVWPSGEEHVVYQTSNVSTRLDYSFPSGKTYTKPEHLVWSSSDGDIADILPDGTIVPKGTGTVTFTLTATNGGYHPVQVTSLPITIKSGGDPSVVVPDYANQVYTPVNQPATVVWATNVMQKYKELAGGGTPQDAYFTVELFEGYRNESDLAGKTPLKAWSAPAEAKLVNATSFTIPGEWLGEISTGHTPSYTVRISTAHPSKPSITLSAVTYIVVYSQPVVVALDKSTLKSSVTDGIGYMDLNWILQNFDKQNGGDFEFKVTKNGDQLVHLTAFNGSDVTEDGGSFRLRIDPVAGTGRLKDVYAITLAAKNSLDDAWSYDSFYLQVYRQDAFRILVDGVPTTSLTMSNVDHISKLNRASLLTLKRNIFLRHEMSINHGDYADIGLLEDQFTWKSSNNNVAVVNYASSGRFANVDAFAYPSYQPKSVFQLAGIGDGQSKITATHVNTGLSAELDVTVETLQDKLYWFQFYPKAKTTITYKDKKGVEKTVDTFDNGELPLYEPDGIDSDVYATSHVQHPDDPEKTITYTGVISRETLLSKERDPATLELYPVNILQLRKLSEVEVFFKTPIGTPYTGKVTYRAGVYKNGEYAPYAEIGGTGTEKQLGADGRLNITFDTTKFYTKNEQNAANLSAKDKIEIVLEVFFENDRYYPQLLYFDGDTSPVDEIVFGGKNVQLVENLNRKKSPIIANQTITAGQSGEKLSILTYTGKFGPNNQVPSITLTTEFMWWGEEVDGATAYAELVTETDALPQGQSYVTFKYPFSDIIVTRHQQVINEDTIWLETAESGSIRFRLYAAEGQLRKSFAPRATLVNMIGVDEVDKEELKRLLEDLKTQMEQANSANHNSPGLTDRLVAEALGLLNKLSFSTGPLKMKVIPTDDPMVFDTLIALDFGNFPTVNSNPKGGGSDDVEFLQLKNYSVAPGLMDLYSMYKGTYRKELAETFLNDALGGHQKNKLFSFGGYYAGEIRYNRNTGKWEHIVKSGGFNAGGGIELVKNINTFVGPVPVTFSLSVGGGLEVAFKASVLYDQVSGLPWSNPARYSVNDYLTSLRIIAYLELFGGVGFDYTVVAAKIGVFGRITIEDVNRWLNREYLANAGERVKYGNMLTLEGIVGIQATLKALFFSITYEFASARYSHSWVFHNWNKIEDYWTKHFHNPLTAANVDVAIAMYMEANGIDDVMVQESWTVEDRSYLQNGNRTWNASAPRAPFGLMALDPVNQAPAALQTNAYPYANPQLADDGSLFVYLSDGNSTAIEDTVASWAIRTAGGYVDMGPITDDPALKGYGDSNLKVAGEGDLIAAVWVRQKETINKDPGDPIRNEDIVLMTNSTEIMAAIYQNGQWTARRLTNNAAPDLAPVVAVGGGKVFVAYRSTGPSKVDNPLDFSASDTIVYTVYDVNAKKWSDPRTLYNGTNGTVMGLAVEALAGGTAAVVYVVNNEGAQGLNALAADYVAGTGNEIVYAVIDTNIAVNDPNGNPVLKNLQVTHDERTDENPQMATAMFPDGKERFVIAWHSAEMVNDDLTHDIKLLAVNADGEVYGGFIDSLGVLATHQNLQLQPNFTFARMKRDWRSLDNLSILWKEAETEFGNGGIVTRDAIKAVKFGAEARANGGYDYYLSGVIDVADMPDYTVADSLDAYVSDPDRNEIKAVILGTTYTTDAHDDHTPQNKDEGDDVPVQVTKAESAMYTATEAYANKFRVDEVGYSPNEIVTGFDMPIQFRIVNLGMSKIESASVTVGGTTHEFKDLNLLPNTTRVLTVYYEVPSPVHDETYEIEAVFTNGERRTETGTIRLDVPNVGISQVGIVEEKDGKRVLAVPIYNLSDATLAGKGRVVKLALYEDNRYIDEARIGQVIEIRDDADLALMDNGGYLKQIEFDLLSHLASKNVTEIPDEGITVFLYAWVEDAQGNVIEEFNFANNEASVWFESLAQKYNEDGVLLTLEQTNDANATTVQLTMQNTKMAPASGGNVLLNLLDAGGNILESRYLAASPSQLLSFGPEERIEETVQFSQQGDNVQALYFTQSAPAAGVVLDEVSLSGVKVDFDPQVTGYRLQASDLKKTTVVATASRSDATVTLADAKGTPLASNQGFISYNLPLESSRAGAENAFSIKVEADGDAKTYEFVVVNKRSEAPKLELQLVAPKNADGDFVSDVEIIIPKYDVTNFDIAKLRYSVTSVVNNTTSSTGWVEVPYDGKSELTLTTVKAIGSHTVEAEVILADETKFALDRETFNIVLSDFDVSASTAAANPSSVLADGTAEAEVVVTLKDRYNHPLSGRKVSLRADGGHSVIRTVRDVTDADGKAVFKVSNAHVETVGYIAKDEASGIELPKVEVRFVTGNADKTKSVVEAEPKQVVADGRSAATVTVTLRDAGGHALAGRDVELTADSPSVTIKAKNGGVTDADGKTAFAVTGTRSGTVTLTARDKAGNVALDPVQIRFVAPESGSAPAGGPAAPQQEEPVEEPAAGADQQGADHEARSAFNDRFFPVDALKRAIAGKLQSAAGEKPVFTDTERHWAARFISLLAVLDAIRGYGDGSFKPDREVTRAEFASMLAGLFPFADEDSQASRASFADTRNHWASRAIERLTGLGLISGYPDGTFRPDAAITREEMVFVIMKLLNAEELRKTASVGFADMAQTAAFARTAVEAAARAGIVSGYPDGKFKPKGNITRAEAAVILVNLLKQDPEIRELLETDL